MAEDFKRKDVEVEHREKKTDTSRVGATAIKWIAILIIVFTVLWFIISYIIPLLTGSGGSNGQEAIVTLDLLTNKAG